MWQRVNVGRRQLHEGRKFMRDVSFYQEQCELHVVVRVYEAPRDDMAPRLHLGRVLVTEALNLG